MQNDEESHAVSATAEIFLYIMTTKAEVQYKEVDSRQKHDAV